MSVRIVRNVLLAAAALACSLLPPSLHAQPAYPSQTIKIVVPNPPGGLPDTISRILGKRLQERLGQSVVVENRPGASAGIGAATVIAAAPDGYTLLVTDGAILSINPLLNAKLPYNPQEILPVAFIARAPLFLAANSNVAAADLKALIDYARANPGKLNYGSIGVGSFHHLSMEAFNASLGLSMNHIPYKGSGESIGALLGGHIDLLFAAYSGLRPAVESKKVRILATNGGQRSPQAPDIPSVAEVAPGLDLAVIQGVMARVGTPEEVVRKIAAEIAAIVKEAEVIQQFAVAGIEPVGAGPEQYRSALAKEAERMAKVVQGAGLKPQ